MFECYGPSSGRRAEDKKNEGMVVFLSLPAPTLLGPCFHRDNWLQLMGSRGGCTGEGDQQNCLEFI